MNRITRKEVNASARRLNAMLGLPTEAYLLDDTSGQYVVQIGCIYISPQGSTNNIYQLANSAGGCASLACGLTLREATDWLNAAMVGVRLARNNGKA